MGELVWTERARQDLKEIIEYISRDSKAYAQTKIAAPRLLVYAGQDAALSVGREVPYMVARDDGSLVVERGENLIEGVFIELNVAEADGETIRFERLNIKISRVVGRQPIADVPFDVGRPIIQSRETDIALRLSAGQIAVVRFPRDNPDDPPILMLLSAKVVAEPAP